jgi:Raf kinase inhibitor-like YbhB/YbcL family protein
MSRRELNRLLVYGFGSALLAACGNEGSIIGDDPLRGAAATATRSKTMTASKTLTPSKTITPSKTRTGTRTSTASKTFTPSKSLTPSVTAQALEALGFEYFPDLVSTRSDATYMYVESRGLPRHNMMVGITSWQRQVPLAQPYYGSKAWQIPLHPTPAVNPISARNALYSGAIALAVNGVPIFNALNNRGDDAFLAGELDQWGGHAGKADDYHYHIAPLHLQALIGADKPIAYALDGYPIYGLLEVDGSKPTGLDGFNGHIGPNGIYHYHASNTYPYINGGMYGKVTVVSDQIDPQPILKPVRTPQDPLAGAVITGFERASATQYSLTYTLNGSTYTVSYTQNSTTVAMHFHDQDGDRDVSYTLQSDQIPATPLPTVATTVQPTSATQATATKTATKSATPAAASATPVTSTGTFTLSSPVVANGGALPVTYTCDGASQSPPLAWSNTPAGTKSFALIMHHVAPDTTHWYWTVYNIPATTTAIPANNSTIGTYGSNSVNPNLAYAPPCSQGPGLKTYIITLYALSAAPVFAAGASVTRDSLLAAIADRTLASSALTVTYTR